MTLRAAALVLVALAALPARADPCAGIAEPLAYNACLARTGPAARAVHMRAAPPASALARTPMRNRRIAHTRRGRMELVFTPRR